MDYYNNVRPIINSHCLPCHLSDNIGAMPLTTYDEVKSYAKMIVYVSENKLMPPFGADMSYSILKYHNTLDANQISVLRKWYEGGMKKGTPCKLVKNKNSSKNIISEKEVRTFAMRNSFELTNDNVDRDWVFVIPTDLEEDIYVNEMEFVPGNKKIVKNCFISIDTGNQATQFDNNDKVYGYYGLAGVAFDPFAYNWYEWMPDLPQWEAPKGYVKRIPAGSKLLFHITYKASTGSFKDSSYLKVKLTNPVSSKKIISTVNLIDTSDIINKPFVISPHEKIRFLASKKIEKDVELHAVMPCGQYACSGWEVYAINGITNERTNILKITNWDAHWKRKYELSAPLKLPAGSTINSETFYNNDEDNNSLTILPPKKIEYGEGSRMEMYKLLGDISEYTITELNKR